MWLTEDLRQQAPSVIKNLVHTLKDCGYDDEAAWRAAATHAMNAATLSFRQRLCLARIERTGADNGDTAAFNFLRLNGYVYRHPVSKRWCLTSGRGEIALYAHRLKMAQPLMAEEKTHG